MGGEGKGERRGEERERKGGEGLAQPDDMI